MCDSSRSSLTVHHIHVASIHQIPSEQKQKQIKSILVWWCCLWMLWFWKIFLGGILCLSFPQESHLSLSLSALLFSHLSLAHFLLYLGFHSSFFQTFLVLFTSVGQVRPVIQQPAHIPPLHYLVSSGGRSACRWEGDGDEERDSGGGEGGGGREGWQLWIIDVGQEGDVTREPPRW